MEPNIGLSSFKPHSSNISRENSFVRQSSIRSEISQSINASNIADLLEKYVPKIGNRPNESFGVFNRFGSRNSSFISNNGFISQNNSFRITPFAHSTKNPIIDQANDRFFEGIDEEAGDGNRQNPVVQLKMNQYGIREYQRGTSFKSYENNSFKLDEQPPHLFFKKPSVDISPQMYRAKKRGRNTK